MTRGAEYLAAGASRCVDDLGLVPSSHLCRIGVDNGNGAVRVFVLEMTLVVRVSTRYQSRGR